jgi:hypothetical protein
MQRKNLRKRKQIDVDNAEKLPDWSEQKIIGKWS